MPNSQIKINQVIKELYFVLSNLSNNKDAIELLTLTKGYKSLFKLKDEEWESLSKMDISFRLVFEKAMENKLFLEEVKNKFSD
jgi:hypothetical protein